MKSLRDLLWKGGFPEIWAENLNSNYFFDDYIQTYLERDLRQILNVTNLRDFRRFLSLLALRVGQLMNYSELSKEVGVAVNTIKSWVNALDHSLHLGYIWENFVFSEYLKEGFVAGKDIFYYRDKNGVEIDFIIEKGGEVFLVEAKHSEHPNTGKLNFKKIAPLFNDKVNLLVALKDFSIYNPLFGSIMKD